MEFLVDDVIKCPQCKEIFKSPVNLPCGHSICKHHVDEVLKDKSSDIDNRKIECLICKSLHQIPENGFEPKKSLQTLFEFDFKKFKLDKEYNIARDNCNIFGDLLDKFNTIKNDPEMRIYSVISELKNKVDLRREEMKQEIDEEALKMIDKLDEFQKECKSKMKRDSEPKLDEKLESWDNSLKQWHLDLKTSDSITYNRVLDESTSILTVLHSEFLNFDRSLFLNRLNQFKRPIVSHSNNFTIKFDVKELSKYNDIKELKEFFSPSVNIDGIDFSIKIDIQKLRYLYDTFFGVYLYVLQNPFIRNLKVDYELFIFDQLGVNKSNVFKRESVFTNKYRCWGNPKMIKLKDLIDNKNLYNVQNDSCTVQLIVNSFEWYNY